MCVCVLHNCLNYAENVTLIIGIYEVFGAFDIIDDGPKTTTTIHEIFKSTLWLLVVVVISIAICM